MARKPKKGKHTGQTVTLVRSRPISVQPKDIASQATLGAALGHGGSSTVYALDGSVRVSRVAKIYKPKHCQEIGIDLLAKLSALVLRHEELNCDLPFVLWPDELIFDRPDITSATARAALLGFTMPTLPDSSLSLYTVLKEVRYRSRLATAEAPRLAARLADHVARLHAANFVFCDMNPKNIHVSRDFDDLYFLDADGFQVPLAQTALASRGITEGYASPAAIADFTTRPTALRSADDDAFVLAILLFQLLVDRAHPFASGPQSTVNPTASLADNIAARQYAYGDPDRFCPDADALAVYRRLAVPLKEAFYCTFLGGRPIPAREWARLLATHVLGHLAEQPTENPTPAVLARYQSRPTAPQPPSSPPHRPRSIPLSGTPAPVPISPVTGSLGAYRPMVPTQRPRRAPRALLVAAVLMSPLIAIATGYLLTITPDRPSGSIASADTAQQAGSRPRHLDPAVVRDVAKILASLPETLAVLDDRK